MSGITAFLLLTTVIFSVIRTTLSKNISDCAFKTKGFFLIQTFIFSAGSIILLGYQFFSPSGCSLITLIFALFYGLFLISAQWMYTSAMAETDVSICSVVYSMGFILPTLSGKIIYGETITLKKWIGLFFALVVIIFSNINFNSKSKATKRSTFIKLLIAMASSGMLGVFQKAQQMSEFKSERTSFLLIAFSFAALISFTAFLLAKKDESKIGKIFYLNGFAIGVCFALSNILNTFLSGKLESAVFFPIQNIGVIMLTILCGTVFFKEKITLKTVTLFTLGCISVFLIAG